MEVLHYLLAGSLLYSQGFCIPQDTWTWMDTLQLVAKPVTNVIQTHGFNIFTLGCIGYLGLQLHKVKNDNKANKEVITSLKDQITQESNAIYGLQQKQAESDQINSNNVVRINALEQDNKKFGPRLSNLENESSNRANDVEILKKEANFRQSDATNYARRLTYLENSSLITAENCEILRKNQVKLKQDFYNKYTEQESLLWLFNTSLNLKLYEDRLPKTNVSNTDIYSLRNTIRRTSEDVNRFKESMKKSDLSKQIQLADQNRTIQDLSSRVMKINEPNQLILHDALTQLLIMSDIQSIKTITQSNEQKLEKLLAQNKRKEQQ